MLNFKKYLFLIIIMICNICEAQSILNERLKCKQLSDQKLQYMIQKLAYLGKFINSNNIFTNNGRCLIIINLYSDRVGYTDWEKSTHLIDVIQNSYLASYYEGSHLDINYKNPVRYIYGSMLGFENNINAKNLKKENEDSYYRAKNYIDEILRNNLFQ